MPAEYGEPLSERELEIVALVADGLTNREIAARIYLSPNTVKVHLRNIFTKTGVASRTELTVLAMQAGWIEVPGIVVAPTPAEPSLPAAETVEPATSSPAPLPSWPRSRWLALVVGLFLALAAISSLGIVIGDDPVYGDGWDVGAHECVPAPFSLTGVLFQADGCVLGWTSVFGAAYCVEVRTDLCSGVWTTQAAVNSAGYGTCWTSSPFDGERGFYRISLSGPE